MKRNLKDYRKEMEAMQVRSESLITRVPSEGDNMVSKKKEELTKILTYKRPIKASLLPAVIAILMAVLALISLILSSPSK